MDAVELRLKLQSIEKRLTQIEAKLSIDVPRPVVALTVQAKIAPVVVSPKPVVTKSPAPEYGEPKSENWLGYIAVLCFVLAAGFIIKLSIDSGWLTPTRQLGAVILFGFALIGAGFKLLGSDRAYASLLPGAGIIVLYVAAFAGHGYYWLFTFNVAIVLSMLVSALCIGLYLKIRHDFYPITAAVGAYIAPIVLGFNTEPVFSIYYFLICSVAFARICRGYYGALFDGASMDS